VGWLQASGFRLQASGRLQENEVWRSKVQTPSG
jgi:hypothetical protein